MGWLKTPWSIQSLTRKNEAAWFASNKYRKNYAFSKGEQELLFAGEHPMRFSASMILLFLALFILSAILPDDWLAGHWTQWEDAERLSYFTTVWSVQATLVALVYPIVIAFATVFLQRRPAAKALIHLYVLHSGALVAGLSSLLLVIVMAIQYVLLLWHGASASPIWVALNTLWFLLNAVLTTFFLYRTVEFLRPEVRSNVIRKYTINIALPRDIRRLSSFQIFAQALSKSWIPGADYLDENDPEAPKVLLRDLGIHKGAVLATAFVPEASRLVDVRFWPLRYVVTSWLREANKYPAPEQGNGFNRQEWPLLIIPLIPGREYSEQVPLARSEAAVALSSLQALLLRTAFVFKPLRTERYDIRVETILEELEVDAREAAVTSDVSAFERAYDSLIDIHELLLGACLDKDENDEQDSWALLPDIGHLFERSLHQNWANSYRSIFLAAIGSMSKDLRPISRLCHLLQHLDGQTLQSSPVEIRKHLLRLPPLMMFQLSQWWTDRVEEQGFMEHGHNRKVLLQAPTHRTYEEVLSTFVSGWESAREAIASVPDASNELLWSDVPKVLQLTTTHIEETAKMLLAAVSRGDRTAAEWLADTLSKWWGQFGHENEPYQLYGKTDYITVEHLELDWNELTETLGLDYETQLVRNEVRLIQRAILLAALKNFWTDIRLLTIELMLSWAAKDDSTTLDESLAIEMSTGFLVGKQWRTGGTQSESLESFSAHGYLVAKVRQYASDGHFRGGYVGRLSNFVERIKDMERPSMVSSRIYSFSGADDVASLQEFQLVLLAVLSSSDWSIGESPRRQIDIWFAKNYKSIRVLTSRLDDWLKRLNSSQELPALVVEKLLARAGKPQSAVEGRARVLRGVTSFSQFVETQRGVMLEAEPVAIERLQELAEFASRQAFSKSSGNFPIQLFETLEYSREDLQDFTLNFNQVRKGELTRVEMDQRASNEDDYWSDTMAKQVSVILLADVLHSSVTKDVYTHDADSYWTTLKHEASKIVESGGHAILILDNASRPEWVWKWQHADYEERSQRPSDLRVQCRDGQGKGYICHFNEIAIYSGPLPVGQSIVLARESFNRVTFRQFDNDQFVEVSFSERLDSKKLVDLKFKFSRKVDNIIPTGVRILYSTPLRDDNKE